MLYLSGLSLGIIQIDVPCWVVGSDTDFNQVSVIGFQSSEFGGDVTSGVVPVAECSDVIPDVVITGMMRLFLCLVFEIGFNGSQVAFGTCLGVFAFQVRLYGSHVLGFLLLYL